MSDKILKLSQAQTLYQDLRERIDALPTDSDIPEVPVQDVQVNGTSILSQGVANVPIANSSNIGAVKIDGSYGLSVPESDGVLKIKCAGLARTKAGTNAYEPIVASHQHESAFYGLAKAAGDSTQSVSTNAVGTYTDGAKAAIQNMLGITNLLSTEESSTATAAHALNSTFMMDGKLHRATAAIAIGDAVEVGTNCEVVKADEVFVKNTDYATGSKGGVVKVSEAMGVSIINGYLSMSAANSSYIQDGTHARKAIPPLYQHEAVYFGLSKLAGVDLANETVTVGTYPETSKTAIRSLIGAVAASDIPSVPVQDVQINGNSILNQGIANIPVAGANTLGTVKINPTYGIGIMNDYLMINGASSADIKSANNSTKAISTFRQHESVFYGLAKAAGDTSQSSSENAVGTYTATAKSAIRNMLGATSSNVIAVQDEQPTDTDTKVWLPETEAQGIQVPTMDDMNTALAGKVSDVQIDGTSIISNGVANIPIASQTTAGVIKIINNRTSSFQIDQGYLLLRPATDSVIKNATNSSLAPIVAGSQDTFVFYGLAKAAGDTTQKVSSNAVGTYTNDAKAAIKNMLGITQTLTITVLTQDNVTVTGQTVTVRAANATGPAFATAAYEGQPVAFAVPSGFAYYVSVSDTLAHHFNPTTASGVITNTDISVTLQYSDFSTIRTAADIKAALNAGLNLTDLVGEQITCTKNGETLTWDVADYDATNGRITLLLHDAFDTANMVFEPAQALMWCENGLAAGYYTFTWNTTQCYFTLTTAIPAGGQLRATNSQFYTYASQDATATLETGTVSTDVIANAIDLGHEGQGLLNHRDRVNYGSNNIAESALQWWLNSDAAANTLRVPVTKFSRAYSYAQPGFMNGLEASFINCLDDVDWLCSTNNVYECPEELGGYTKGTRQAYSINAKFCLASEMEIFGSYGGTADGSTVFDLYNGADADDRKKYRGTSAQTWWLRSPFWSRADYERYVSSSGGAGNVGAYSSYAVVPACRISRDSEVIA